jgi:hypothetical protein
MTILYVLDLLPSLNLFICQNYEKKKILVKVITLYGQIGSALPQEGFRESAQQNHVSVGT